MAQRVGRGIALLFHDRGTRRGREVSSTRVKGKKEGRKKERKEKENWKEGRRKEKEREKGRWPLVTVKVKWSRYRPGVAQRVGRGIAVLFHDRGTRRGWVVSSTPRPHFTPGKDPVSILQEAGWAPGPVWTGGKSRPTGIRSRTVQPVAQSLYRLSYRAHIFSVISRWILLEWEMFLTKYVGTTETHKLCSIFFLSENRAVYETMWKKYCRARETIDDNITRRMRVTCWITHSECVILFLFLNVTL